MKKLMFTLALLSAFTGQAQAELKWKKIQAGASGGMTVPVITPNIIVGDGSVKVVGWNNYGQLGTTTNSGTHNPNPNPITIIEFYGAKQCSASGTHTVCIMADGSVKATGFNNYGQLGDGTTTQRTTPVTIAGFNGAKECFTGTQYTFCVMNDGSVKSAGMNNYGQLGDGTTTTRTTPVTIHGFNGAKQCSASDYHTVCIMADGSVKASGNNQYGQLGTTTNSGTSNPNPNPITIPSLAGAKECIAGSSNTICIMSDGTVKGAGYNRYGQLGTTTNNNSENPNPNPITMHSFAGAIKCSSASHTVCIMADGSVKTSGNNMFGQLGITTNVGVTSGGHMVANPNPTTIPSLAGAIECYPGYYHTICVMNDGTVKATGRNNYGQLGDGTTIDKSTPVTIPGFNGDTKCSTGGSVTLCINGTREELPTCDSLTDTFAKTADGIIHVCKNNIWTEL